MCRCGSGRRPATAQHVCVFRTGNVGDITCVLPAIHAVREAYPEARLTLLTSPGPRGMPSAVDVLEGAEWVDANTYKIYMCPTCACKGLRRPCPTTHTSNDNAPSIMH